MRIESKVRKIFEIVLILMIICMIAGTIIAAGYSVNQSDDYSHAMELGVFHIGIFQYIGISFKYMVEMYLNWAGNYFSMFLQGLLSPLNMGGIVQLRIVMLANALLFFATFYLLIWNYLKNILGFGKTVCLVVIALIIYSLMNYRCYYEIFYWFSGATSYSLPLACLLGGLNILIIKSSKKFMVYCAYVLFFLAAGGSLNIAGVECYILLLMWLFEILCVRKIIISKKALSFFIAFVGTLINVIAPGNYVRADGSTISNFVSAIKYTVAMSIDEATWLFKETNFIAVVFVAVIIGALLKDVVHKSIGNRMREYTWVSALALVTFCVSIFPVVLGYNMPFLANRTQFMIEISLIVSMLNMAIIIGVYLAGIVETKNLILVLAVASICMLITGNYGIKNHESITTTAMVLNGTFREYYDECLELEIYFTTCKGQDIEVTKEMVPDSLSNFSCIYLENGWVNDSIAAYYGMKSLTLVE